MTDAPPNIRRGVVTFHPHVRQDHRMSSKSNDAVDDQKWGAGALGDFIRSQRRLAELLDVYRAFIAANDL